MEVLSLHIGACGVNVATSFWSDVSQQHGVDMRGQYKGQSDSQLEFIETYFSCAPNGAYRPRALLVDLDHSTLDTIRASSSSSSSNNNSSNHGISSLYEQSSYVYASGTAVSAAGGAADNFALGYHGRADAAMHTVVESIRERLEACDRFQGFQLHHSLGGGTGAGLSARVLQHLVDVYPHKMRASFAVQPSPHSVVGPYNSFLCLARLLENAHFSVLLDNGHLGASNDTIAQTLSGLTGSLRFKSALNNSMRKMAINLVPFKKLSVLAVAHSPKSPEEICSVNDLAHQLFEPASCASEVLLTDGRFLGSTAIFCGSTSEPEIDQCMREMRDKYHTAYVDWLPDNLLFGKCAAPPSGGARSSATLLANTTSIKASLRGATRSFQRMYSRRAFLHLFTEAGMEVDEFDAAQELIRTVTETYEAYEVLDEVTFFSSSEEEAPGSDDYDDDDSLLEEGAGSSDSDHSQEFNQMISTLPEDTF